MQLWDRRLAILAIVTILVAWAIGAMRSEPDIDAQLHQALPGAQQFVKHGTGILEGMTNPSDGVDPHSAHHIGYVAIASARGYGGPMRVAVGVNPSGIVVGLQVLDHNETAAYFQRVIGAGAKEDLVGKSYQDPFLLGQDLDAVTGATTTFHALAESVRLGSQSVANQQLGLPVPPRSNPRIQCGLLETTLTVLFGIALLNYAIRRPRKRLLLWISLIASMLIVGFVFNAPITLTHVNSLLLGYWPQWQTHIHWYLLVAGVLLVPLLTGRNPYCRCVCPFGAAQQCLGALGTSKRRLKPKHRAKLRWLPRLLAWGAILLALVSGNPAKGNYEIYGGLFHVIGTPFQFALLAIVLITSLYITRPWCNFLCPIGAVTDFLRFSHWQARRVSNR